MRVQERSWWSVALWSKHFRRLSSAGHKSEISAAATRLSLQNRWIMCALAGKELVIWRDAEGQWRCFQDKCPHRCTALHRMLSAVLACRKRLLQAGRLLRFSLTDWFASHLFPAVYAQVTGDPFIYQMFGSSLCLRVSAQKHKNL